MNVLPEGDHMVVETVCKDCATQHRAQDVIDAWDEKHRFLFATQGEQEVLAECWGFMAGSG